MNVRRKRYKGNETIICLKCHSTPIQFRHFPFHSITPFTTARRGLPLALATSSDLFPVSRFEIQLLAAQGVTMGMCALFTCYCFRSEEPPKCVGNINGRIPLY